MNKTNPFSSCYLKPGANTYLFAAPEASDSIEDYSQRKTASMVGDLLAHSEVRMCIVGPHGTGKSTLMVQLMSDDRLAQIPHARIQLSSGNRDFSELWDQQRAIRGGVFAVDGYEQLDWFSKFRLIATARKRRQRLIVTAHTKPLGFKLLHQTHRTPEMDIQIVHRLLSESPAKAVELLQSEFWRASKQRHAQNLRESLFDAYDWYEQHQ